MIISGWTNLRKYEKKIRMMQLWVRGGEGVQEEGGDGLHILIFDKIYVR